MNITIDTTTYTNAIQINFNDYSTAIGFEKSTFNKKSILKVAKIEGHNVLEVEISRTINVRWKICLTSIPDIPDAMIIDTIDGVVPTDINNLMHLITQMML